LLCCMYEYILRVPFRSTSIVLHTCYWPCVHMLLFSCTYCMLFISPSAVPTCPTYFADDDEEFAPDVGFAAELAMTSSNFPDSSCTHETVYLIVFDVK